MRNKAANLDGVTYYNSLFDAQDVAKQVDGKVKYHEEGWAVQYNEGGLHYPEEVPTERASQTEGVIAHAD